jgi:proteasome lid subunit RPN8/RPN11
VRCETKKQKEQRQLLAAREDSRPKRQAAKAANIQLLGLSNTNPNDSFHAKNMHELVEVQRFLQEYQQPVTLFITLEALLLMTVHSHIHRNEVIGFVSGHRVRTNTMRGQTTPRDIIIIQETVPCAASEFDGQNVDYSRNVEMNPESAQIKAREIEQKGLSLLGWYHSHPKFEVNPSHIDVVNHQMYQRLFNEEGKDFIGLIISPYFNTLSDASTSATTCGYKNNQLMNCLPKLRCFVTINSKEANNTILPYEIAVNILPQTRLHKQYLMKEIEELCYNPFACDKIALQHETCMLRLNITPSVFNRVAHQDKKSASQMTQIHLKKGEKLIRTLRQLLEMNLDKLRRQRVTACQIAKHLTGLTMLKTKPSVAPERLETLPVFRISTRSTGWMQECQPLGDNSDCPGEDCSQPNPTVEDIENSSTE